MSARPPRNLLAGLNPPQLEAVRTTEGPVMVLAGAGTGKTRVITTRIAHLLREGVPASSILAVTFTNKAAKEMMERVRALVPKKVSKGLTVSTFHSFAVRLLRAHADHLGYRKNFSIADEQDQITLMRSTQRELGISEEALPPKWGYWQIGSWKNDGIEPEASHDRAVDEREVLLAHVYERYAEEMKRRNVVDFDDMLMLALRLLRENADVLQECRDRFHYFMVDEFQDTNDVQFELIRLLSAARRNLCVVGDDDQSIYAWRGARPGHILDFSKKFTGTTVITLDQNYRSTNTILKAANQVIGRNPSRHPKDLWSALGEGERIALYCGDDERDEMLWVMSRLQDMLARKVRYEDIAILFRANAQSREFEVALRERNIPYKVVGTRSLFDHREVRDLLAYLKVIANPRDDGSCLRIINTPPRGIGKGTQDKLLAAATERRCGVFDVVRDPDGVDLTPRAREALAGFRELMTTVARQADDIGLRAAIETLIERSGYRAHVEMDHKDEADAAVRMNVIADLARMADSVAAGEGITGFLEAIAMAQNDEDDDDDQRGITLMTVHAAKGLEFENVFLIGVEEGLFPHKNSLGEGDELDSIEEERRLFYVAVTRARRNLFVSLARNRTKFGRRQPRVESRFLSEIEDELFEVVDPSSEEPADEEQTGEYLSRLKGLFAEE